MDTHYDSCAVCHEAVMVYAIGNCDHPICYRCSTRMRTLCGQNYCPICRTDLDQVYMVHDRKKFSDIPRTGYIPNRKYKVFFEDNTIKEKFEKLLEHCCPKCKTKERTLKALSVHLSRTHSLFFCDLCLDHLKIFTSERKFYSRADLATHRRQGDKDDKSYKGHPLCQFCDIRYLDNDDLFRHLRKDHYFCHFCDTDGSQDYYNEYGDLRDHFRAKHYLCEEGECINAQFTNAFRSNIDFKAHMTNEHSRNMSKQQAKQTRTIDVNIQLAPRNRRRDRGVLRGEDYEEVSQRPRPYSGRGSHAKHKDRHRDDDMERAIQASLSVMKEENMRKAEKTKEERSSPIHEIKHTEEEFPTLGNVPVTVAGLKPGRAESPIDSDHRDSDSERSSESLAKRLAKKSSQSVQHGAMGLNDFPSLHDDLSRSGCTELPKETRVLNKLLPQNNLQKTINKPIQTKSVPPPKSYDKKLKSGPIAEEEFPGLPASNKPLNTNLSWVNKPATKPSPSVQIIVNSNQHKTSDVKKSKSDHVKRKPFDAENDFPTLGGSGAGVPSSGWLKHVNEPRPQKIKAKQVDWFDVNDSDEFKVENLKGDKDNKQLIEESLSKNKKKKKKKTKASDNNQGLITEDQGIKSENHTLDNIAFTLLDNPDPGCVTEATTPSDVSKRAEDPVLKKKEVDSVAPITLSHSRVIPEEPSPSHVESNSSNSLPKTEVTPSLTTDDFPSLDSTNTSKTKAPPPGFGAPKSKNRAPPGFGTKPAEVSSGVSRPPPGFSAESSGNEVTPSALSLKNLLSFPPEPSLPATDLKVYDYSEPPDFQQRNKALISSIRESISEDLEKFEMFRKWSGDFRKGSLTAEDYYEKCQSLLGEEKFGPIFSELLVLLPDITKQQDLLQAHRHSHTKSESEDFVLRISGKSKEAPWSKAASNFQSCSSCKQVLLPADLTQHMTVHSPQESDFPVLGGKAAASSGPGMRAWLKAT